MGGDGGGDGRRAADGVAGTPGRRRAGATQAGTARALLPRRTMRGNDVAVERRGVPRTAGARRTGRRQRGAGVSGGSEWAWIRRFAAQFEACGVHTGETALVLCERASRPALVEASRLALASLGAQVAVLEATTPVNPGPVPIRSTGASVAIAGHPATIAACAAAGFVVDCTVEGLLHAPELAQILGGGARVLMVSNEHPEVFDRVPLDPDLAGRVE